VEREGIDTLTTNEPSHVRPYYESDQMKAKAKRPQRKRGKPMHVPTAQMIATVRAMCGVGYPQVVIARNIGISDVTLRAHYREVIDNAVESASINEAALGTVDAADKVTRSCLVTRSTFGLSIFTGVLAAG
jgi:hypothetical protein